MFEVGSTVIYRNHVCLIAGMHEKYFEDKDYYELHAVLEGSLKFYIVVSEAKQPAVRPAMNRQEALKLIEELPALEVIDEAELNVAGVGVSRSVAERQLKDEYARRVSQCSPRELAVVVKSAYERIHERELTGKQPMSVDKKFLSLAEKLLYDELSVSLDMPREDVPDFIQERMACISDNQSGRRR